MHRRMELARQHGGADLRHEGTALAAMGQQLAGLVEIARGVELDDLDVEIGHGSDQAARDLFRLCQRHRALACADFESRSQVLVLSRHARIYRASSNIMSEAFSAIMMIGALVFPDTRSGM